jgi:hypothetical protein
MAETVAYKYRAFISYSHVDTSWAKWLHRGLEGFHIDKDLVGRKTATGTIAKTLRPIFRDRDDFIAGDTLSEQTAAALDASQALVVICSPASAKSRYVNEEIRLFKSQHPDRQVIPLIIAGRPDDPTDECFPAGLKFKVEPSGKITIESDEPLGADVRNEGDGKHLALAKVVAGLLGASSDDIFRRAERERRRRLRLLSAATAAILALVSFFGIWADVQRERFANYLALATTFQAFEVADETRGWEDPHVLAQDTLIAAQQIVSKIRGFENIRILWFDDKPALSQRAKQKFQEGMQGVGVFIQEESDIAVAKEAIKQDFDVVIANYGEREDRFAYQLLSEIARVGLETPLVIYGIDKDPKYAREARCYGAVARTTEIGTLFSAVIRALAPDTRPKMSDSLRQLCHEISPDGVSERRPPEPNRN